VKISICIADSDVASIAVPCRDRRNTRHLNTGLITNVAIALPTHTSANLLETDWTRRYRSRYRTVSQTIVALVVRPLQPVEDTLSTALTNVPSATRTLSYLRVLL